jgi:hypothetical protein
MELECKAAIRGRYLFVRRTCGETKYGVCIVIAGVRAF